MSTGGGGSRKPRKRCKHNWIKCGHQCYGRYWWCLKCGKRTDDDPYPPSAYVKLAKLMK